jgi:hypothetical protein
MGYLKKINYNNHSFDIPTGALNFMDLEFAEQYIVLFSGQIYNPLSLYQLSGFSSRSIFRLLRLSFSFYGSPDSNARLVRTHGPGRYFSYPALLFCFAKGVIRFQKEIGFQRRSGYNQNAGESTGQLQHRSRLRLTKSSPFSLLPLGQAVRRPR